MNPRVLWLGPILMCGCPPSSPPTTFGPGHWTLEQPVEMAFPPKAAGPWSFRPVVTTGTNGMMVTAQGVLPAAGAPELRGEDLTLAVRAGTAVVVVLEAPPSGPTLTVLDVPMPIWYLAAPPASGITSFDLTYAGQTASWDVSEGAPVTP